MIATTGNYYTVLNKPHFKRYKIEIAGVEYQEASIIAMSMPTVGLFQSFGIGNCVARQLELQVLPEGEIPRQAKITVYVQLVGIGTGTITSWVPQGVFYIASRRKDKISGALTITAYDAMLKAEETWLTADYAEVDWPMTDEEAAADIAARMGLVLDSRNVYANKYPIDFPVDEYGDMTMREVLSGIAVSNAGNWVISIEQNPTTLVISDTLRLIPAAQIDEDTNYLATEDGEHIMIGGVKILV